MNPAPLIYSFSLILLLALSLLYTPPRGCAAARLDDQKSIWKRSIEEILNLRSPREVTESSLRVEDVGDGNLFLPEDTPPTKDNFLKFSAMLSQANIVVEMKPGIFIKLESPDQLRDYLRIPESKHASPACAGISFLQENPPSGDAAKITNPAAELARFAAILCNLSQFMTRELNGPEDCFQNIKVAEIEEAISTVSPIITMAIYSDKNRPCPFQNITAGGNGEGSLTLDEPGSGTFTQRQVRYITASLHYMRLYSDMLKFVQDKVRDASNASELLPKFSKRVLDLIIPIVRKFEKNEYRYSSKSRESILYSLQHIREFMIRSAAYISDRWEVFANLPGDSGSGVQG